MKLSEENKARHDQQIVEILQKSDRSPVHERFDPVEGGGARRLQMIRESFIREMTRLAITHNAINLSQGFPDFDGPAALRSLPPSRTTPAAPRCGPGPGSSA